MKILKSIWKWVKLFLPMFLTERVYAWDDGESINWICSEEYANDMMIAMANCIITVRAFNFFGRGIILSIEGYEEI